MTSQEVKQLSIMACKVRMGIIESTHAAKCGHPGGSMSAAEMLTYLYFKEMNVDPADPKKADRDRFVLSKGHAAPGLYAALANRGFFPVEDLLTLRHVGSHLQGHPNMNLTPGIAPIRKDLDLAHRMERAVYLGLDEKNITAKYVADKKIIL